MSAAPDVAAAQRRPLRLGRWWLAGAVTAVIVGPVLLSLARPDPSGIDRAADLVADAARFDSGERAAETLAEVSLLLEEAAEGCRGDAGEATASEGGDARCQAMFSAAGWTRVAAVGAARCTAPGRAQLRAEVAAHLRAIDELEAQADVAPPALPRLPDCASLGAASASG